MSLKWWQWHRRYKQAREKLDEENERFLRRMEAADMPKGYHSDYHLLFLAERIKKLEEERNG